MKRTVRGAAVASRLDPRLRFLYSMLLIGAVLLCIRLGMLMVVNHDYYVARAASLHEVYVELFPRRGEVYVQDSRSKEEYPLAMNRDYFTVFADTTKIRDDETAEALAETLAEIFGYDDEKKLAVFLQLNKRTDPYEPLEQRIDEAVVRHIQEKKLPGIHFARKAYRVYPEGRFAAPVIGFVGKDDAGNDIGSYGIEGYWQRELAGKLGFFEGERSAGGFRIPIVGSIKQEQEDGADMLLTIDRTLQYQACRMLEEGMAQYGASGAALVILEPKTGAIRAMCSFPDFDPNTYNQVPSIDRYNNKTIFEPYEPGSIFKPIAMAAALNEELVNPSTPFYDPGFTDKYCTKPIRNADGGVYEQTTMTGVLENSINTGMVKVAELLGKKRFKTYIEAFGFGVKTGVGLNTEVSGNISTLSENSDDTLDCYTATASFGQGITATPLQMVAAFGAIANGGVLMKPYIVEEVRYSSGKIERYTPTILKEVISRRAATLLSGMLVTVIDSGQAGRAAVPGYYVAGKTGTAQIAGRGGYTEETNHSFVGFAPVDDPAFVMLVKYEKPAPRFSSLSAAPTFGRIAAFVLQYYGVPPARE